MATWRVQIGITFPDMSGIIKGKRVKAKGKRKNAPGRTISWLD